MSFDIGLTIITITLLVLLVEGCYWLGYYDAQDARTFRDDLGTEKRPAARDE